MPGWHAKTQKLQESGKLQVVGLIQEQHPERCRLFMQWKRMGWPILVDSLNLLGVRAVPYAILLDEHGIVRSRRPDEEKIRQFLKAAYPRPQDLPQPATPANVETLAKTARASSAAVKDWRRNGDALFLRGQSRGWKGKAASGDVLGDLNAATKAYKECLKRGGGPEVWFRLGVVLRRRHELGVAQERGHQGDFQAALRAWGKALDGNPNQYIWRRRIQQYGPRLDKPYSFYDWVKQARKDIASRGEQPVTLAVEPGGAEFAYPTKEFPKSAVVVREPDPRGKIHRDKKGLITLETAVAPAVVRRGKAARVHLIFQPDRQRKGHWNNEAGTMKVWLQPPDSVEVATRLLTAPSGRGAVSDEIRQVDFEVRVSKTATAGKVKVPVYALYYVCEGESGVCEYLRQDGWFELEVK